MESAKECVTTHLPKQLALKMDGALALSLYPAAWAKPQLLAGQRAEARASRRVAAVCVEGVGRRPAWSRRWCRSWW